jgi:peptide/nickel transport system substrate-binding protein
LGGQILRLSSKLAIAASVGAALTFGSITDASAVKRGGTLTFVVGSKIPSFDAHRESTFGMIHPIRPFYSLLLRVNPDNPKVADDFVCDICTEWTESADKKKFVFSIRKDVTFHNGQKLTAHDVVATYNKIVFPPKGVGSSRKAHYQMVDKVSADGDYKVVFDLKFATGGYMPAMASPFNFIYSKDDLDKHGLQWHQKNVNGTGAYKFVQHQPGAFVEGKRHDKYHHMGADGKRLPYLDGYKAVSAPKMAIRLQAIRGDRAAIEFRGFPPKARDDLVKALGDKITVQEGTWNCVNGYGANQGAKGLPQLKDVRVRQALALAPDRWGGSKYLSKIAIVKTVGGMVFPDSPLAMTKDEMLQNPIFNPDNKARHAQARMLLKEAGAEGLPIVLWNRAVDQPYKIVGTWLVDQWRKVGFKATQAVVPTGIWYAGLRKKKDGDINMSLNCQSVINPLIDVSKWQSSDIAGNNYANYIDRTMDDLWQKMNRTGDAKVARATLRKYETRGLWDKAHWSVTHWWYKINPHRSYVKGWKQAPSHYLNQHLDQIWLDK